MILMIKVLLLAILAYFSGWLYHRGGSDGTYHGKERDWGCSLCAVLSYSLFFKLPNNWIGMGICLVTFLLTWGALSTYHKYLNKYFDKSTDNVHWFNWLAHGIGVGLATIPFVIIGSTMTLTWVRAVILGALMMVVSELSDDVWVEENGRGALIVLTTPLLLP